MSTTSQASTSITFGGRRMAGTSFSDAGARAQATESGAVAPLPVITPAVISRPMGCFRQSRAGRSGASPDLRRSGGPLRDPRVVFLRAAVLQIAPGYRFCLLGWEARRRLVAHKPTRRHEDDAGLRRPRRRRASVGL